MAEQAQVADLIGDIYDAALDPSLWPRVLRRTMTLADGASAAILAPHFRRAAAIAGALDRSNGKAAALSAVLDRISAAVVFVDQAGRMIHANEPAAQALARGEGLVWSDGRARPRDAGAAAHLEALLTQAQRGRLSAEARAFCASSTAPDGQRVTVHVLPLSAGTRRNALAPFNTAAAILVATDAPPDPARRAHSAAKLYAFTPAESRVVQALLSGCTIGGVARLLGITEATVKTHLQHLFDKTGTRRQVELIRLVTDGARAEAQPGGDGVRAGTGVRAGSGLRRGNSRRSIARSAVDALSGSRA